jgi:putative addiction module killer protein
LEVKFRIDQYLTPTGKNPFREWLSDLPKPIAARIEIRLHRLECGNLGDVKGIGDGVFEARFDFGSGYRIYFGREGRTLIVLLCAGNKSSQWKDIQKAKQYWRNYLEDKNA